MSSSPADPGSDQPRWPLVATPAATAAISSQPQLVPGRCWCQLVVLVPLVVLVLLVLLLLCEDGVQCVGGAVVVR